MINRANARVPIFESETDFLQFEKTLYESWEQSNMRILAYVIMPNHWHLVLYPADDQSLSLFMSWLTNTHVKRWQASHDAVGTGHLYQSSFKAFPVQTDNHCYSVLRYVESNPLRAKLVKRAEDWRWSSLWLRLNVNPNKKKMLSIWPIEEPMDYLAEVNELMTQETLDEIRESMRRGKPFGKDNWMLKVAKQMNIKV
ncbi:MAG: transposase [Candidatus Taylorbacteria bacterium]|nr:transposase [Candidatus Taylorbacteria bacterium]